MDSQRHESAYPQKCECLTNVTNQYDKNVFDVLKCQRIFEISSDFNSKLGQKDDFLDDLPANFYQEFGVKSDPSR